MAQAADGFRKKMIASRKTRINEMKRFAKTTVPVILAVIWLLPPAATRGALLLYDGFDYTAGEQLGGTSSSAKWENAKSNITIATNSLNYAGLPGASGNRVNVNGGSYNLDGARTIPGTWASQTNGALYCSFLLRLDSTSGIAATGTGTPIVNISSSGSASQQLISLNLLNDSSLRLGVVKYASSGTPVASVFFASGTGANLAADGSTIYLVVAKYQWVAGAANDLVALWVNPAMSGGSEDTGNNISTSAGSDGTGNAGRLYIDRGPVLNMDELRHGTTWADVVPGEVAVADPVITQAFFSGHGLVLRGSNGPASSPYQVLASTNLALAVSNWPAISTNAFDVAGRFDFTNPVNPAPGRQFFRLRVGGTLPPPPAGPVITNQPQSLTVTVGANANFLVGASGEAPLGYFWSLNTGTPVGGNSATLALPNVQPGDAGSYRVIVSNSVGTATSAVATLTVLMPPAITADPTNLTVAAGAGAVFHVTAQGSAPLQYQWFYDTDTLLDDETNATLTLSSVSTADAGAYSVTVSNAVGSVTSSNALLTVLGPPVILTQPQSHSATVSNDTTFAVEAAGPSLAYEWFFNTNSSLGVNSNQLALLKVQPTNAGVYHVIVTNTYGAVTSSFAWLTVNTSIVTSAQFNLVGFGRNTTGGGEIPETDPAYAKVTNALQLANAVLAFNKTGGVRVIEIMNDLDLGWNELGADVQNLASTPFNPHSTPKLHPRLITTGVSKLDIKYKNGGLTIFSANGAAIRHCTLNIKGTHNIIVRNLKFDEMWEWDESSKGKYDGNDWDFIDLANGGPVYDIWIDHCTFTKAYDGIVDFKAGSTNVTLSWCRYLGDDGATNSNSFVWQQINSLESNKTAYAMYNFLRNNGFSTTNIVQIIQGHDKTHLMGSNEKDPNNANLSCTFHHLWFQNCWDRVVPRLRAGNVHDFNLYVDDREALVAKRLRDAVQKAMSATSSNTLQNTYSFNPFLNGSISTEGGAILVENSIYQDCLTPLRNNQTDPSDPTYTGKIMAVNSIYSFLTTGGTTNYYAGSSTNSPGDTYFGPAQAPIIPFSWNGFATLPYSYTNVMADPAQLPAVLASGAGAGVVNWAKTNWLKTSY
jgi:pectate lyase